MPRWWSCSAMRGDGTFGSLVITHWGEELRSHYTICPISHARGGKDVKVTCKVCERVIREKLYDHLVRAHPDMKGEYPVSVEHYEKPGSRSGTNTSIKRKSH